MPKAIRRVASIDSEKSYHLEGLQEYWLDVPNRELWIRGMDLLDGPDEEPGVEYRMATRVIMNLHILRNDGANGTHPVLAHLHTCGGHWNEGMAIYDTVRAMPYETTMISYTHARSMSSLILQAATNRYLMPSSYVMVHRGTLAISGEAQTVQSNMDFAKRDDERMIDIYLDRLEHSRQFEGQTRPRIRAKLEAMFGKHGDVFLTPKEAIDWNLADGIVTKFNADGSLEVERG